MRKTPTFLALGTLILVSSLAAVSMAYLSFRHSEQLADAALENLGRSLATAIASGLPADLSELAGHRQILDSVLADELVAFARITNADGLIRYHSNPDLEGSSVEGEVPGEGEVSRRFMLGTGEEVFEYGTLLPTRPSFRLHLFLRTVKADQIVNRARALLITVVLVVALMWILGVVALWSFMRKHRVEAELREKRHLAYLGQMSAVLAHELRNALGSIKGYAQWLEEKVPEQPSWTPAVETIVRESHRIERLVTDLLLYSRPYEPVYGSVFLGTLLRETARDLEQEGRRISLNIPDEVIIESDEEKLRSVFRNLFRNAADAVEEGGGVRVQCRDHRDGVSVEIQDDGPGLNQEALEKAFTPFFTTKARGSGLGLAYSKKVIETLGGRISLSNRNDGRGALAQVILPVKRRSG